MTWIDLSLCGLAFVGHATFCVASLNRAHSFSIPRWTIGLITMACWGTQLAVPFVLFPRPYGTAIAALRAGVYWPLAYLVPCWTIAAIAVIARVRLILRGDQHPAQLETRSTKIDISEVLGHVPINDTIGRLLARLPGNQALQIHIEEKTLQIPRMEPALNGVSIAHLTDLHMSGTVDKPYYEQVVDLTNAACPDLVLITGDLFDSDHCLDWIDDTLARLEAPGGVFFILGNHDRRVDSARARRLLSSAGLVDLGGTWRKVRIAGNPIILAGNELPWFGPAADMTRSPTDEQDARYLRILLSHSPDQFAWARRHDFDLMLAGHNHGGQIRIPGFGPLVSPSRQGVRFAAGTFYQDPTVLHVSRGISSLTQLRWNCPPELALLTLRSGAPLGPESGAETSRNATATMSAP